jgi:hypothetical protein
MEIRRLADDEAKIKYKSSHQFPARQVRRAFAPPKKYTNEKDTQFCNIFCYFMYK